MTRVATFNTTKSSVLSRQIRASMAKLSPKPKLESTAAQGAAGLMKSHNLGNKLNLLAKSLS